MHLKIFQFKLHRSRGRVYIYMEARALWRKGHYKIISEWTVNLYLLKTQHFFVRYRKKGDLIQSRFLVTLRYISDERAAPWHNAKKMMRPLCGSESNFLGKGHVCICHPVYRCARRDECGRFSRNDAAVFHADVHYTYRCVGDKYLYITGTCATEQCRKFNPKLFYLKFSSKFSPKVYNIKHLWRSTQFLISTRGTPSCLAPHLILPNKFIYTTLYSLRALAT